jgi:hypothetical protein
MGAPGGPITVRQAGNLRSVYELDVTTSGADAENLLSKSTLDSTGLTYIVRLNVKPNVDGWIFNSPGIGTVGAGGAASGQKDVLVNDGTLFRAGDAIFIRNAAGESEWRIIDSISSNTLTLTENLTYSYSQNEVVVPVTNKQARIPLDGNEPFYLDGIAFEGLVMMRDGDEDLNIEGWVGVF